MIKELLMDERKIQKNFINQINGKKKVQKKSIGVYKYLVHHSFFEVLTNAYPEFYTIIKNQNLEKEFDRSIFKFMQKNAMSPYIWQMPNEYRKFLKKSKYFKKISYLNDLLHFEYSELFIFMQKPPMAKSFKFKVSKKFILSPHCTLHKYNYDVVNKNFTHKEDYFILGYFDNHTQQVVYRPLNNLLFSFLKTLNSTLNLNKNLRLFLNKNELSFELYEKEFKIVLEELYIQKVLIV